MIDFIKSALLGELIGMQKKTSRSIDLEPQERFMGKERMEKSIMATKQGFEDSFLAESFYNKQTQDVQHLQKILDFLPIKSGMKLLDLGTGSGYLAFAIAEKYRDVSVVGLQFPFPDRNFDMVVSRYALHHFPDIQGSICEVQRVIKSNGFFFISDPTPNVGDLCGFADEYMRLKKDGHIKFYRLDEWKQLCGAVGMKYLDSFESQIRFPKKKDTAYGFEKLLKKYDKSVIADYQLEVTESEIYVTEQVNNVLFSFGGD